MAPVGSAVEAGSLLFEQMTSFDNLFGCWIKARKNKSQRPRVQRFNEDPLRYLVEIRRRLRSRTYAFGPYKTFIVREKKFRHVVDAPMKDRIVHWMLYQYMLPIWQPRFIHDTYGNLPGRGTHAAVNRLAQFARSPGGCYALQMDISKYFFSVNHDLLKERVLRYIGDHALQQLLIDLIDSYTTDGQFDHLFSPDSVYRRTLAKGMPVGNLPSQLFANIYLSPFDHWMKQTLRVRRYIRYVDDIAVLASTRDELQDLAARMTERLAADGLTVHPRKIRLAPTSAGIPFLGYVVWPNHISAGQYVRQRYLHRLRQHERGVIARSETLASYRSIFLHTGSTIFRSDAQP